MKRKRRNQRPKRILGKAVLVAEVARSPGAVLLLVQENADPVLDHETGESAHVLVRVNVLAVHLVLDRGTGERGLAAEIKKDLAVATDVERVVPALGNYFSIVLYLLSCMPFALL